MEVFESSGNEGNKYVVVLLNRVIMLVDLCSSIVASTYLLHGGQT
jgi:hypothetical protein